MQRICVIGAGIVGAAVAFHLSRHAGTRVSIVDSGAPGAATTDAGTGWVTARGESDPEHRALELQGMAEHLRLGELFPTAPWLTTGGTLQSEDAVSGFDELVEACREAAFPVEVLGARRVNEELEPNVAFGDPELRVAHFPTELTVAGALLSRTLFEAAIANGAIAHLGSRVTGLRQRPGGGHRVHLAEGTWIDADVVVNAAGAHAPEIAASYDIPMPMSPQPGIGVRARVDGTPLGRMVYLKELVIKPETTGFLRLRSLLGWRTGLAAGEPDSGFTGGLELNDFVEHVIEQARTYLPSLGRLEPFSTMTGIRPIPADGHPRVGEVESVPGYFEAVMHSGGGLAPIVGRLLAEEITTGRRGPELEPFRPLRGLPPALLSG